MLARYLGCPQRSWLEKTAASWSMPNPRVYSPSMPPWRAATLTTTPYSGSSRSEEHTSELQSRGHLVCRLLLEKKKHNTTHNRITIIDQTNSSAYCRAGVYLDID